MDVFGIINAAIAATVVPTLIATGALLAVGACCASVVLTPAGVAIFAGVTAGFSLYAHIAEYGS